MNENAKTLVELLDEQKRSHDLANQVQVLMADKEELLEALEAVNNSWLEDFKDGPDTKLREGCSIHEDTVKIWKQIQSAIRKHRSE